MSGGGRKGIEREIALDEKKVGLGLLAFRLAIRAEKRNGLNWLDGEVN